MTWEAGKAREQHLLEKACQLQKARIFKRSLGIKAAAGYMRDRGWSVEAAAHHLGRA